MVLRTEGWRVAVRRAEDKARGVLTFLTGGRDLATLREGVSPRLVLALLRATSLQRQFKLDESLESWKAIWTAFPNAAVAYAGYGAALGQSDCLEDAAAILSEGERRFPDASTILIEHVAVAHRQGDPAKALALSRRIQDRFPDNVYGPEGAARAFRDMLRFDEAEAVLARALDRFPRDLRLQTARASIADARGDWAESLHRWEGVLRDHPDAAVSYAGVGAALKRLKRFEEADALLATGLARFPDDVNLGINYAWAADDRGDWAEGAERWTRLQARFPHHDRIRTMRLDSQSRSSLAELDALADAQDAASGSSQAPTAKDPPQMPDDDTGSEADHGYRDLFMRFESLGDNCEFGFVQRHFGAEPLGLLRWTGIDFEPVRHGLSCGFERVGSPETTEMKLNPSNHEYYTTDKVYGMSMHTFITRDDGNEERIYGKLCRRLQYLRTKLLDDLRAGEKIFVFQTGHARSDQDLRDLHTALRRHGGGTLLFVRLAGGGDAAGSVRKLDDGLLAGFIDRVGFDGKAWSISFDVWLKLCLAADAAVRVPDELAPSQV